MQLKLKRTQRSGLMGKVTFALDALVDLSAEEAALVKKYALGKMVVYDSQNRQKYQDAAEDHLAAAAGAYDLKTAGKSLWRQGRALANVAMAALSLRVTIDSLTGGQHIECKDMDELIGAESAMMSACKNVRSYLETALTFDGREDVFEF